MNWSYFLVSAGLSLTASELLRSLGVKNEYVQQAGGAALGIAVYRWIAKP